MGDKKKYQPIVNLKDLQDKGQIYRNDVLFRTGNKKVVDERLEELLSFDNKMTNCLLISRWMEKIYRREQKLMKYEWRKREKN